MKTIAFIGQKGGSGKTTLAVHAAVAAQESGENVVVIDTDPQKSASVWRGSRRSDVPVVVGVGASELPRVLSAARSDKMSLAIIDTAPHAAPAAAQIARHADLVVLPCRPTAFDIAAIEGAVSIVRATGVLAVFVLSACPLRAPEIAETRNILEGYGLLVSPAEIGERRAFARAVATGRAVTEFEEDGKAAVEIRTLWAWLKGQL